MALLGATDKALGSRPGHISTSFSRCGGNGSGGGGEDHVVKCIWNSLKQSLVPDKQWVGERKGNIINIYWECSNNDLYLLITMVSSPWPDRARLDHHFCFTGKKNQSLEVTWPTATLLGSGAHSGMLFCVARQVCAMLPGPLIVIQLMFAIVLRGKYSAFHL